MLWHLQMYFQAIERNEIIKVLVYVMNKYEEFLFFYHSSSYKKIRRIWCKQWKCLIDILTIKNFIYLLWNIKLWFKFKSCLYSVSKYRKTLRDYKIFDIYSLHTLNDATNPCMNFDHANTVHDFFDHTNLSTFFASQVYLIYEKISDLLPLQR